MLHRLYAFTAMALTCVLPALPAHAVPVSATASAHLPIPDGSLRGALSTVNVEQTGLLHSLSISVALDHGFVGDLVVQLEHYGTVLTLLDRPGRNTSSEFGYPSRLVSSAPVVFNAAGAAAAGTLGKGCTETDTVGVSAACLNTLFLPKESLRDFNGSDPSGAWTLGVFDHAAGYIGELSSWTLNADFEPTTFVTLAPVPEPATGVLALAGMAALLLRLRGRAEGATNWRV